MLPYSIPISPSYHCLVYCTFLWKILICGKYALGRGRSWAVLACSLGYYHLPPPSFFFYFFQPILWMTFKTLQNEGQLLLGFNYKLTQGHILSPKALAYYSNIWNQWRPVARLLRADRCWSKEGKDSNML